MFKSITACVLGLAFLSVPAAAETFTFESMSKSVGGAMTTNPAGAPYGGSAFSFTSDATFASGSTSTTTGMCVSWSTPGLNTNLAGVCNAKEGDANTFDIAYACSVDDKGAATCWGSLIGRTGRYEGKSGHGSWVAMQDQQGGGTSNGIGAWSD